jgi:hypothetical protein
MHTALNVLHHITATDKYIYVFDDANRDATLRQIAQHAADPELSLTWRDAAMLSKKIRETLPIEEPNEGQASQQNHTQVAKLAAAAQAKHSGKGVAKCGHPSRRCGDR